MSATSRLDSNDRKIIIVATATKLRSIAARALHSKTAKDLSGFYPIFSPLYRSLRVVEIPIRWTLRNLSEDELLEMIDECLDLGLRPVNIEPSDARRDFRFGVGIIPKDGSIFVQHPIMPKAYIDPSEYNKTLSREKEAAFRQLASCLGAKRLTLISATVHEQKGLFGARIPMSQVASQIGIKAEFDKTGSVIRKVYSEYGPPRSSPKVPSDLQPWVDFDPDLRTMARDRVRGSLLKHSVSLEFKEGVGIGGELAAKLVDRGFSVTASYEKTYHSIWNFEVEYYPGI